MKNNVIDFGTLIFFYVHQLYLVTLPDIHWLLIDKPTVSSSSPVEYQIDSPVINEKHSIVGNTADFDDPAAVTANDFVNSETSNDDCLSQSPLNLTRSQGLFIMNVIRPHVFRTRYALKDGWINIQK